VKDKEKDGYPDRWIRITFYDPRATGEHKPVEAGRSGDLRKLSLRDCFAAPLLHFSESDDLPADAVCLTGILPSIRLSPPSHLKYLGLNSESKPSREKLACAVYSAIAQGITQAFDPLCTTLKDHGFTGTKALAVFQKGAELHGEGTPAITSALQDGLSVLKGIAGMLVKLDVDEPAALAVIQARRPSDRTPALWLAAQEGHPEAFEDTADALRILKCSRRAAIDTLMAKDADGMTAIYAAAEQRHKGSFASLARALVTSGVTGHAGLSVLEGKCRNGETVPRLFTALDDQELTKEFVQACEVVRTGAWG
jgi:hypothetical protein